MHILFLSPWYPNKKDPMPGLFVQRHAIAASQYCKVHVLFVKAFEDQQKTEWVHHETPVPEIHAYSKKSGCRMLNYYRFVLHHFKGFKRITTQWKKKPDLVHVNILTREGVVALLFKWIWGIPYVVTEHWSRYGNPEAFQGKVRKWATQLVLNNAEAIMPVTQNLQHKMIGANLSLPNRVEIVPNVVDTDFFKPGAGNLNPRKRILHISCFDEKAKNVKGILRVIKELSNLRDDFDFVLVGDGKDFNEVKEYSDKLDFEPGLIQFCGLKEGEELLNEIQQANVHLMFSHYENLPVVNLECFACGVPVISSDVGGIKEFFNDKLGRLVEANNEEELLSTLQQFLDDAFAFDSQYIRDYAVKHFSNDSIARQLFEVYQEAIKK